MMERALPAWGPYTKRYAGISHIADAGRGIRFDLSVFPGLYRRKVDVPNVTWESGYHPWEASADLDYFSFRHEILWKDALYCDIAYTRLDAHATLVRCAFVNNTDSMENLALHYMASLAFPTQATHSHLYKPLTTFSVKHPDDVVSLHALAYDDMGYQTMRPTDSLMPDALKRGELRHTGLVAGSGLGIPRDHPQVWRGFGMEEGDWVRYRVDVAEDMPGAFLQIRYAQWEDGASFTLNDEIAVSFPPCEGMSTVRVPLGGLGKGEHVLTLRSNGGACVLIDSLLIGAEAGLDACAYVEDDNDHQPSLVHDESARTLLLKYAPAAPHYGLYWDFDGYWVREILHSELDTFMRANVHHHTNHIMQGDGGSHFTNVFQRPIPVGAHSERVLYGVVVDGDSEDAARGALMAAMSREPQFESIYRAARAKRAMPGLDADPYAFSQERMAATTLSNMVYPVYRQREFIRHNTPGRWWDCLYTWDSGFTGIGLNVLSPERAMECLDTYLTEPGDAHNAFIHHGSMVPTQFYLMQEIWNSTRSREWLEYAYPRLRQYYEFFVGRLGSSSMAALKSGILKTWDYFYNSGGWDDYPPQVYVHRNAMEKTVAPAITSAQAVRIARIMAQFAKELGGFDADIAIYDADAERLMGLLNEHAYDAESGYFSYTVHDENGDVQGVLRHESGENFNMGLDGAQPVITGLLTDDQLARITAHIFTPGRMWSDIGISSVDQRASYFTIEGYWNGAVWMPHQWFIFKAMLDAGNADGAFKIADTALGVWKNEVETSYHCFEHFIIDSGRGAGWHQFSGLSSPVLYWHAAYYAPGRLTYGYDVWVHEQNFADDCSRVEAKISLSGQSHRSSVIVATMAPGKTYRAHFSGEPIEVKMRTDCAVELLLPNAAGSGVLVIESE